MNAKIKATINLIPVARSALLVLFFFRGANSFSWLLFVTLNQSCNHQFRSNWWESLTISNTYKTIWNKSRPTTAQIVYRNRKYYIRYITIENMEKNWERERPVIVIWTEGVQRKSSSQRGQLQVLLATLFPWFVTVI